MYKADKKGKPILFISAFYENTSVQDNEKNWTIYSLLTIWSQAQITA